MKLVVQRMIGMFLVGSEIIRLSSIELQKLELQLQKTNQQNWQLARANSQMLAVYNLSKYFLV